MINYKRKGSLTLEAALVVPIVLCVIITVAFLMKVVIAHEVIQRCITDTANKISVYSYLYDISGLKSRVDDVNSSISSGAELSKGHVETLVDGYEKLNTYIDSGKENPTAYLSSQAWGELKDSGNSVIEAALEAKSDPKREVVSLMCIVGELMSNKVDERLIGAIVKLFMAGQLDSTYEDAESGLHSLGIDEGFKGLNFTGSRLFKDEKNVKNEDIEIVISYKLKVPVPIKFIPEINIKQRAVVRAWLNSEK